MQAHYEPILFLIASVPEVTAECCPQSASTNNAFLGTVPASLAKNRIVDYHINLVNPYSLLRQSLYHYPPTGGSFLMTHHPENDPADTPEVRELFGVIASCYPSASGFSGVVVRSVNTKYATASDFFSGVGASKSGGRWNRKGLEATYTSLDIETAIKEAYQNLLHYGFPISNIRPRTTAGAKVKLKKVFDILDAIDRSRLLLCRLRGPHRPIGP